MQEFAKVQNPYDMTAQILNRPGLYLRCIEPLLADPEYGVVALVHAWANASAVERFREVGAMAMRHGKMACIVWCTNAWEGVGATEADSDPNLVVFRSADRCFATIAAWYRREQRRLQSSQSATEVVLPRPSTQAKDAAGKLLEEAASRVLSEREAKNVLALYGVRVVEDRVVHTVVEARGAAREIGYPVVLKLESPDIAHKTEAGVVQLDIRSDADCDRAYHEIHARLRKLVPTPRVYGILVQPMVRRGVELMIGARIDPDFGPMVVAGFGGVLVELLRDTVLRLAPVSCADALRMIDELRGSALLDGFRTSLPVNRLLVAEAIVRVSELAADQRDTISELDINPLICAGDSIVAADALIVRRRDLGKVPDMGRELTK